MHVEKVSKYISINYGLQAPTGEGRRVLLSLPRVKWLEAQPDYEPWPPLVEHEKRPPVSDFQPTRYTFRPQLRSDQLSPAQQQAWDLYQKGLKVIEIAERLGKSANAAGKLLAQAKEKLGVGLEK